MDDDDEEARSSRRGRKNTKRKEVSKKEKPEGPNTDLNDEEMVFGYLDIDEDDESEGKVVPHCQWATIYCPMKDKDDPTIIVPAIFHDVQQAVYRMDKDATFQPVDKESDMPELHQESERIDDVVELGDYFGVTNPLSTRKTLPLGKDGKK